MEDALTDWLLDIRPYTHLNIRIRQFILYCRTLCPELSYNALKRIIVPIVNELMLNGKVGRLWMRDRNFARVIRLYGQSDQRTQAWHTKRGEMITASEVYKAFGSPEARRELIMRKLEAPVVSEGGNQAPALIWGTRFEEVAKRIYQKRTNCTILDVSCVQHPVIPFLGASPDGLIIPNDEADQQRYGRLVEFKCPFSRPETPGVPEAYIQQMQMQMECTGIDECEYVEFRFKQCSYTDWIRTPDVEKGFFSVDERGKVDYDSQDIPETSQPVYWVLTSIKEDFLAKDTQWLEKHEEELRSLWAEVVKHREAGTKPVVEKKPALTFDL